MALSKIKTNSIADNAITSTKIGVDVIVAEDLASNSITVAEIASNAVTTAKIADANVTTDKLATTLTVTHALGSASTPSITFTGDTNTGIFSPTADTIAFAEGGAEAMRIDSSGNVGIGTTSPGSKLHVYGGTLNVEASSGFGNIEVGGPSGAYIDLKNPFSDDYDSRFWSNGTDTQLLNANAGVIQIYNNGSERMRIDSSGNVGIGTASPSDKLNMVVSSSSVDPVFGGTSNQGIRLQNSNATVGNFTSILNVNSAGTLSSMIAFRNVDQNTPNTAGAIDFVTRNGGNLYRAMTVSQDGNLQFNSGYGSAATAYGCRAWVNFNGTGTVAIRASGNVSSITDNGIGDYTVNFTTAMVDANYCAVSASSKATSSASENQVTQMFNYSTGSIRIGTGVFTGVANVTWTSNDQPIVCVSIFR